MSIQESNRLEDEFIGSVIAELAAEKAELYRYAIGRTSTGKDILAKNPVTLRSTSGQKSIVVFNEPLGTYEAEVWTSRLRPLDRRDDITKPDTTYSFPPRTLSW